MNSIFCSKWDNYYPTWRHSTNYERVAMPDAGDSFFCAKLEAWRHKILHIFLFLQTDRVLGIANSFSWIFNVICKEKSWLISVAFLLTYIDVRTVKFFPNTKSWLVNSNFPYARKSPPPPSPLPREKCLYTYIDYQEFSTGREEEDI